MSNPTDEKPFSDEVHLFLDTNVLLHYRAFEITWRQKVKAKRVCIHIAQPVLEEISTKKDMGESKSLRKRADRVGKQLLKYLETSNPFPLREGEELFLEAETPRMEEFPKLNGLAKDDQLIAAAITFNKKSGFPCYIVTGDSSLTLRVKIRQWTLELVVAPDEFRLPDETDTSEREKVAIQKELSELKKAQPILELSFQNDQKILRIDRRNPAEIAEIVKQRCQEEQDQYEFLREAPIEQRIWRTVDIFGSKFGATPEEAAAYNNSLRAYFSEYREWVRKCFALYERTAEIKLSINNSGSVPANSVHVKLHFPDGFDLVKSVDLDDELPRSPKPPQKPGLLGIQIPNIVGGGFAHLAQHSSIPPSTSISIRKTHSYDVEWEKTKLRQHSSASLHEMSAIFESEIRSFTITYEIRADNLREVAKGKLHVISERE